MTRRNHHPLVRLLTASALVVGAVGLCSASSVPSLGAGARITAEAPKVVAYARTADGSRGARLGAVPVAHGEMDAVDALAAAHAGDGHGVILVWHGPGERTVETVHAPQTTTEASAGAPAQT